MVVVTLECAYDDTKLYPYYGVYVRQSYINKRLKMCCVKERMKKSTHKMDRVIGTLLGSVNADGIVEIKNSFPVRHTENDLQVAIDMEYQRQMFELHQKVNSKETIVGWYATGRAITEYSVLIHDFYQREAQNPVHLTLDTNLEDSRMDMKVYVGKGLGAVHGEGDIVFSPVHSEVVYLEAERIVLDLCHRAKETQGSTVSLETDLSHVEKSFEKLQDMLACAHDYVNSVLAGEIVPNRNTGRFLSDTVASIPKIEPKQFAALFKDNVQDLLMVTYLANLTRSQLSLAEQLSSVL